MSLSRLVQPVVLIIVEANCYNMCSANKMLQIGIRVKFRVRLTWLLLLTLGQKGVLQSVCTALVNA